MKSYLLAALLSYFLVVVDALDARFYGLPRQYLKRDHLKTVYRAHGPAVPVICLSELIDMNELDEYGNHKWRLKLRQRMHKDKIVPQGDYMTLQQLINAGHVVLEGRAKEKLMSQQNKQNEATQSISAMDASNPSDSEVGNIMRGSAGDNNGDSRQDEEGDGIAETQQEGYVDGVTYISKGSFSFRPTSRLFWKLKIEPLKEVQEGDSVKSYCWGAVVNLGHLYIEPGRTFQWELEKKGFLDKNFESSRFRISKKKKEESTAADPTADPTANPAAADAAGIATGKTRSKSPPSFMEKYFGFGKKELPTGTDQDETGGESSQLQQQSDPAGSTDPMTGIVEPEADTEDKPLLQQDDMLNAGREQKKKHRWGNLFGNNRGDPQIPSAGSTEGSPKRGMWKGFTSHLNQLRRRPPRHQQGDF